MNPWVQKKWARYEVLCSHYNKLQAKYSRIVGLLELKEPQTRENLDLIDEMVRFRDEFTRHWLTFKEVKHKTRENVEDMILFVDEFGEDFVNSDLLRRVAEALRGPTDELAGEFERLRLS